MQVRRIPVDQELTALTQAYEVRCHSSPDNQKLIFAYLKHLANIKSSPSKSSIAALRVIVPEFSTIEKLLETDAGKLLMYSHTSFREKCDEMFPHLFSSAVCEPSDELIEASKDLPNASDTWCHVMRENKLFFPLVQRLTESGVVSPEDAVQAILESGHLTEKERRLVEQTIGSTILPPDSSQFVKYREISEEHAKLFSEKCLLDSRNRITDVSLFAEYENFIVQTRALLSQRPGASFLSRAYFWNMLTAKESVPGGKQNFLIYALHLSPRSFQGIWQATGREIAERLILSDECLPIEMPVHPDAVPFSIEFVKSLAKHWWAGKAESEEVLLNAQQLMEGLCERLFEACKSPAQVTNLMKQLNYLRRVHANTLFVNGHYKKAAKGGLSALFTHRPAEKRDAEKEKSMFGRVKGHWAHAREVWNQSNPLFSWFQKRMQALGIDEAKIASLVRGEEGKEAAERLAAGAGGEGEFFVEEEGACAVASTTQESLAAELAKCLDSILKNKKARLPELNGMLRGKLLLSAGNRSLELSQLIKRILLDPVLVGELNLHSAYLLLGYVEDTFVFHVSDVLVYARRLQRTKMDPMRFSVVLKELEAARESLEADKHGSLDIAFLELGVPAEVEAVEVEELTSVEELEKLSDDAILKVLYLHREAKEYLVECLQNEVLITRILSHCVATRPDYLKDLELPRIAFCDHLVNAYQVLGVYLARAYLKTLMLELTELETEKLLFYSAVIQDKERDFLGVLRPHQETISRLMKTNEGLVYCLRHKAQLQAWDSRYIPQLMDALRYASNVCLGEIQKEGLGDTELWQGVIQRDDSFGFHQQLIDHQLIAPSAAWRAVLMREAMNEEFLESGTMICALFSVAYSVEEVQILYQKLVDCQPPVEASRGASFIKLAPGQLSAVLDPIARERDRRLVELDPKKEQELTAVSRAGGGVAGASAPVPGTLAERGWFGSDDRAAGAGECRVVRPESPSVV
jgi:hypothetical protein